ASRYTGFLGVMMKDEMNFCDEEKFLQAFWNEADHLSGVDYFDVVNAGLNPKKYHYPESSMVNRPVQLDFKIWNRSRLCCYFRELDTGNTLKLNLFYRARHKGRYAPEDGEIDFKQAGILGDCFYITISINNSGNPKFEKAEVLLEEGYDDF
ncbi:hypothetical protein ACVEU9_005062, partial [Klebsiella aerogenes]|nr:hypothetical protein [Citrobacter freundii]